MTRARFLCIGTHHKTGTVWMRRVIHAISADQDIPIMQCYRPHGLVKCRAEGPQFVVNWASTFPFILFEVATARFLHIIRDPRDVLISGMRYHRSAPLGNEKWLREGRPEWGGRSYQQQLNALPDDSARLLFEMEHKHDQTVKEMLGWPWGHPNAFDVRYEDLIQDSDCAIFRRMLERFAIEGLNIDRAVQTYWDKSLFGGLKVPGNMDSRQRQHVSSGEDRQWRTALPFEVARVYARRYGAALRTLGYAADDSWLDELEPAAGGEPAQSAAARNSA